MKRRVTILTTVAWAVVSLLAGPGSSAAQSQQRERGLGGVLDTLSGILTGAGRVHGTVVLNKDTSLVLRGDDGRTYAIDTTQINSRLRAVPQSGDGVTVVLAQARGQGGSQPKSGAGTASSNGAPVATQLDLDSQSAGTHKPFRTVEGSIEQPGSSQVMFRTRDGLVLPIDVTGIVGLPPLTANEPATLYYEQGQQGQRQIVGVWLEPGTSQPSAATSAPQPSAPAGTAQPSAPTGTSQPGSPGTPPASASRGTSQPSASIPEGAAGSQSLHGLVESMGIQSFTLAADDGRKVTVQTSQLDPSALARVRPGDLVTVSGRASGTDTVIASSVQPDTSRR